MAVNRVTASEWPGTEQYEVAIPVLSHLFAGWRMTCAWDAVSATLTHAPLLLAFLLPVLRRAVLVGSTEYYFVEVAGIL